MPRFCVNSDRSTVARLALAAYGFPPAGLQAKALLRPVKSKVRIETMILLSLAVLLLGCLSAAHALDPSIALARYSRQAWEMESGLPQDTVQALAQTQDGFVWLGTEAGLVRFDGVAFQTFDHDSKPMLPGADIRCLLATSDGALWIGTSEGLARWQDGKVTSYSTRDGLPGNGIRKLVETADGALWVWTDQGLARRNGKRFVAVTAADGLPAGAIDLIATDNSRRLWIATAQGLFTRSRTQWEGPIDPGILGNAGAVFFASPQAGEYAVASKSSVAVLTRKGVIARLNVGKELPGTRIQTLLADREGSLWIGTNSGLTRWRDGELDRLPVTDRLATASVLALAEDREGDLWVGTETDGLHILRDRRFWTWGTRGGLSSDDTTAVVEDGEGTLWVGTTGDGLNALRRSGKATGASNVHHYSVSTGLASDVILSLAAAPNGDLWVGTPDGLNRIRGSGIATYTSADGLPDDFIRSLLIDTDGSLWIGTRRGLAHWKRKGATVAVEFPVGITVYTHADGLGSDLVGAMARDAYGDLWIATLAGVSRLHAGRITNFTTADGLSSNVVTAILPRADGSLLIGTQFHGLDVWDGRRFSATKHNGLEQTTIHAILDDGRGHLWFATGDGIARCDYGGMSSTSHGLACGHWMKFGTEDGLRSRGTSTNAHPSAWRSRNGLLWFATPKGLVEVDPAHFPINTLGPPVVLERFVIDDVDQPLSRGNSRLRVPAGHVHFEFDYAGLSFVAPQKVRYRYMLAGVDHAWIDAGARRTAYYTNIPPGKYTFRVQAANNDGVWNVAGSAFSFELEPHFYQTAWFYALLLAAIAAIILLLMRLRLRHAEGEFRAVLGERSRIAREIHDTLAQGYVGVSAQLELLAELLRLGKLDEAAKHLDLTRRYVREGLAEARQSIWELRTQDSRETTLPVRLGRIAEAAGGGGLEAKFSVFGAYRPLPANTERELLRVAQEAIHNVKRHAEARRLSVQLEYGPTSIALEVRDDGRGGVTSGMPESQLGRYGLTGMKERAASIGGSLEVYGEPGEGTTVRLRAPAPESSRERPKEAQ